MAAGSESEIPLEEPPLPLPIFRLSSSRPSYMLYDINTVTWLRQTYHILGVQIGGMPQFPQQNVFLGLPLELMPEEVQLLVDKGVAYVVDDLEAHDKFVSKLKAGDSGSLAGRQKYGAELNRLCKEAEDFAARVKQEDLERVKSRKPAVQQKPPESTWNAARLPLMGDGLAPALAQDDSLFGSAVTPRQMSKKSASLPFDSWAVTPATTLSLIPRDPLLGSSGSVGVSAPSYALYSHLHERSYYMSPGLRFGCQFMAYPGDPLRYHSHFLCTSADWDEEMDLLDVIGGGRLGTGVKKGYLLGGVQPDGERKGETRTFCIEWGGL